MSIGLCNACQHDDHSFHSGPQLAHICIGCSCEWMPNRTIGLEER